MLELHWNAIYSSSNACQGGGRKSWSRSWLEGWEKDAEAWGQLLEDRSRNVGQFQNLQGLENPELELGQLIPLITRTEAVSVSCLKQALWSWN